MLVALFSRGMRQKSRENKRDLLPLHQGPVRLHWLPGRGCSSVDPFARVVGHLFGRGRRIRHQRTRRPKGQLNQRIQSSLFHGSPAVEWRTGGLKRAGNDSPGIPRAHGELVTGYWPPVTVQDAEGCCSPTDFGRRRPARTPTARRTAGVRPPSRIRASLSRGGGTSRWSSD